MVGYEWIAEEVDRESGDVLDVFHASSFKEARETAERFMTAETKGEVGLVRDDDRGRSWAYLEQGIGLSEWFRDAYGNRIVKTPKKFLKEVGA